MGGERRPHQSIAEIASRRITIRPLVTGIFLTTIVAMVSFCIGFTTVVWSVENEDEYHGLWSTCVCSAHTDLPTYFIATRILSGFAMAFFILAMICLVVYIGASFANKVTTVIVAVVCYVLSVIFLLSALLVFGVKAPALGFSYIIAAFALVSMFIATILVIIESQSKGIRIRSFIDTTNVPDSTNAPTSPRATSPTKDAEGSPTHLPDKE